MGHRKECTIPSVALDGITLAGSWALHICRPLRQQGQDGDLVCFVPGATRYIVLKRTGAPTLYRKGGTIAITAGLITVTGSVALTREAVERERLAAGLVWDSGGLP